MVYDSTLNVLNKMEPSISSAHFLHHLLSQSGYPSEPRSFALSRVRVLSHHQFKASLGTEGYSLLLPQISQPCCVEDPSAQNITAGPLSPAG
jgi:hypothetical protein